MRVKDRRKHVDGLYETPAFAIEALLEREKFNGITWEPACGKGNISSAIKGCIASDIRTDSFIAGKKGVDFLKADTAVVNNIVTNPPYSLAERFVIKALESTDKKVAMLLRLLFLEGKSRYQLFQTTPLKAVYVFSGRIACKPEDPNKAVRRAMAFAWFVWEHRYVKKPCIEWIKS